jgi:CcmD family protein
VSNLSYLFVAFLITWIVIGAYLWMLNRQVQNLKDEVDTLTEESVFEPERFSSTLPETEGQRVRQG